MLTVLNLIQLVLYIALLALMGQGVLHVLAGAGRASNPFYRVLQSVGRPFTRSLRWLAPRALSDVQVAVLTFVLLVAFYVVVTAARADWCLSHRLLGQAGLPVKARMRGLNRGCAALLQALGLETAALRLLDCLCEQAPGDTASHAQRLQLLALAGAWPAALADSAFVLARQPGHAASWFNHGYLLEQAERWAEAGRAFERATQLDPQLDRAWYGLGLVRIRQGRLQEAAQALARNTVLQPLSPHGWYQLARVQLDLQQPEAASQTLRHLQAFEPRVAAQLMRDMGLAVPVAP